MDALYKALFGKFEKSKSKPKIKPKPTIKSRSRSKTEEEEEPICDNCGRSDCTRAQYDPWGPCDNYGANKKKKDLVKKQKGK